MSLAAGTVTVDSSDASFSGSDLALALMNAKVASFDPRTNPNISLSSRVAVMQSYAAEVNANASALTAWLAAGGYT